MQDIQNLMSSALLAVSVLGLIGLCKHEPASGGIYVRSYCVAFTRFSVHGHSYLFAMCVALNLTCWCLLQTEKMDAKCVTWQEANMKMELANMIFDDLIEDTAFAFCDAHNMPMPTEV